MDFVIRLIKGLIIGIGVITSGAGTFAILLRVYDKCMKVIAHPFKHFKKNMIYVVPIVIGIAISVLLLGKLVVYLLSNYNSYMKSMFLGIIIGGIPILIKKANKKGFEKSYYISLAVTFIFTVLFTLLTSRFANITSIDVKITPLLTIIYGAIYGFGAIVPGMSTIHLLIYMGVLSPIVQGIYALDLNILVPFGLGYLVVVILTARLISYLFEKFYGHTYYSIIGFSITSLYMLFPKVKSILEFLICVGIFITATIFILKILKFEVNNEKSSIGDSP